MQYGIVKEKFALEKYRAHLEAKYRGLYPPPAVVTVTMRDVGMFIHESKQVAASPDAVVSIVVKDEFGSIVTQDSGLAEVKCPTGKYFCSWNLPAIKDYESEFIDYNGSHPTYGQFSSLIDESKYKPWLEGQSID